MILLKFFCESKYYWLWWSMNLSRWFFIFEFVEHLSWISGSKPNCWKSIWWISIDIIIKNTSIIVPFTKHTIVQKVQCNYILLMINHHSDSIELVRFLSIYFNCIQSTIYLLVNLIISYLNYILYRHSQAIWSVTEDRNCWSQQRIGLPKGHWYCKLLLLCLIWKRACTKNFSSTTKMNVDIRTKEWKWCTFMWSDNYNAFLRCKHEWWMNRSLDNIKLSTFKIIDWLCFVIRKFVLLFVSLSFTIICF